MYKWNARDYHKSSSEQQKWAEELIEKLKLRGNERVLDIGCGDGKVTAKIAECVPKGSCLGIDSSEEMIRFAWENFPPERLHNLSFRKMDVNDLPFDNEFDVVFSNACLHWVINHLPVLTKIKSSLKPAGRILLQMGGKGNAAKIFEVLKEMLEDEKWGKFFNGFSFPYGFYNVEEYKKWLNETGLKAIRVELIPKDMTQKGKEALLSWISTTWLPYIQQLPEELQEKFINELADKYIEKYPLDKDGFVHIAMVRLEVEAENGHSNLLLKNLNLVIAKLTKDLKRFPALLSLQPKD